MKSPQEVRLSFIYDKDTTPDGPVLLTTSFYFRDWSNAGYELRKCIRELVKAHVCRVEKLEAHEARIHAKDIENAIVGVDGIPYGPTICEAGSAEAAGNE